MLVASEICTMLILNLMLALPIDTKPEMMADKTYKIKITVDNNSATATLFDNATSRDFIKLLPLDIELRDYARAEKIYDLPKRLSTAGTPDGMKPYAGDITYYAPWGNIALFYKGGNAYASGLISLGKIDGSADLLNKPGSLKAKLELIEN